MEVDAALDEASCCSFYFHIFCLFGVLQLQLLWLILPWDFFLFVWSFVIRFFIFSCQHPFFPNLFSSSSSSASLLSAFPTPATLPAAVLSSSFSSFSSTISYGTPESSSSQHSLKKWLAVRRKNSLQVFFFGEEVQEMDLLEGFVLLKQKRRQREQCISSISQGRATVAVVVSRKKNPMYGVG
ncbi:hypothetical protein NE237_013185 [Protea cynaroides]|uniref:Uncharacterized protein n=1 Tax=Protea cynaroides TaxID=273540 RepID=A0A9Q0JYQ4_9MAGN|nr:hypothetical protein NE237_013185 [Protea cynaroides]